MKLVLVMAIFCLSGCATAGKFLTGMSQGMSAARKEPPKTYHCEPSYQLGNNQYYDCH